MAIPMTATQIAQAAKLINTQGAGAFYAYMQQQGFNYASLANGIVSGTSFSGAAAINFILQSAAEQGVPLTQAQLPSLENDLAQKWAQSLEDAAGDGTISTDLDYATTLAFHASVFAQYGLGPQAWTLYAPGQVLTSAQMQADYQNLLNQIGTPVGGAIGAEASLTADMVEAASLGSATASNWVQSNILNIGSDISSILIHMSGTTEIDEPDGSKQYTDSAGDIITEYSYVEPLDGQVGTYTITEDVISSPIAAPQVTVTELDSGLKIASTAATNAAVLSSGAISVSGTNILAGSEQSAPGNSSSLIIEGNDNNISLGSGASAQLSGTNNSVHSSTPSGGTAGSCR